MEKEEMEEKRERERERERESRRTKLRVGSGRAGRACSRRRTVTAARPWAILSANSSRIYASARAWWPHYMASSATGAGNTVNCVGDYIAGNATDLSRPFSRARFTAEQLLSVTWQRDRGREKAQTDWNIGYKWFGNYDPRREAKEREIERESERDVRRARFNPSTGIPLAVVTPGFSVPITHHGVSNPRLAELCSPLCVTTGDESKMNRRRKSRRPRATSTENFAGEFTLAYLMAPLHHQQTAARPATKLRAVRL